MFQRTIVSYLVRGSLVCFIYLFIYLFIFLFIDLFVKVYIYTLYFFW